MKIYIPNDIFNSAVLGIKKPHEHAFERVGYFLGTVNNNLKGIEINDWFTFDDSMYEKNDEVGARVGAVGMKKLMVKALSTNKVFLQFHLHDFAELPDFSFVDLNSLKEIIPALFSFSSATLHGALVGNDEFITSLVWISKTERPVKNTFKILKLWEE